MSAPLWEITLSGSLGVRCGEVDLSHFRTRKTALLLAYLACYSHRTHRREELLEHLFPEHNPEAARNLLRVTLTYLRKALEVEGLASPLVSDREHIRLDESVVSTDRKAFDTLITAAHRCQSDADKLPLLRQAASLYQGEMLGGMDEAWIVGERQRWNDAYLVILRQIIRGLVTQKALEPALGYALQSLAVDRYREESHRTLMRLYVAMGRPEMAVRQYEELVRLLHDELSARPSALTTNLLSEIKDNQAQAIERGPRTAATTSASVSSVSAVPDSMGTGTASSDPVASPVAARTVSAPAAFPALPSALLTPLFGRDDDILRLRQMLDTPETRLITLTGLGGVGKTRLSLAAAKAALPLFESHVAFVELAALTQPEQIADAILSVLPVPRGAQSPALEQVSAFLADRRALLVLDNCEHLLPEGSAIIHALMEAAPALTCLVTSRERLRLRYEYEFPVRRLPTPPTVKTTAQAVEQPPQNAEKLTEYASVAMFVERAQQACPGFILTSDNAAVIGTLCSRLEGLPLAIELAAAWTRTLTPAQIEKRLTSCLNLLVTTQKDMPARHASLRAALDGSYQLLAPALQTFLAKLSVFRGGLTLEAAEAVCEEPEALSYLAQLCEGSLVIAETSGEIMRYRLLEMVLEYAREKLQEQPKPSARAAEKNAPGNSKMKAADSKSTQSAVDVQVLQRQHAHYFREWTQAQEKQLRSEHTAHILRELDADYDNLRTALEWFAGQGEAGQSEANIQANDEGLLLASALWRYWDTRGYSRDGLDWLDRLLGNEAGDKSVRAGTLAAAGYLAYRNGRLESARMYFEESIPLCIQSEDRGREAMVLVMLGNVARSEGDDEQALQTFEQVLQTARELNDVHLIATILANLGNIARDRNDYELAMRYNREATPLFEQIHDRFSLGLMFVNISRMHLYARQYEEGKAILRQALEVAEELEDRNMRRRIILTGALLEVGKGEWERGVLLLSAAETLRTQSQIEQVPGDAEYQAGAIQAILAHISVATFEQWWERGRTLTWQEMNALINEPSPPDPLSLPVVPP